MTRHRLTLGEQVAILKLQAICPECGEPLGAGAIAADHRVPLALGGADTVENLRYIHVKPCHSDKTFGPKTKAHRRGTDIGEIAHSRRLARDQEEFRARLLTKEPGKAPTKPRSRLQGRGFEKRRITNDR